jgi:hypothetical protein
VPPTHAILFPGTQQKGGVISNALLLNNCRSQLNYFIQNASGDRRESTGARIIPVSPIISQILCKMQAKSDLRDLTRRKDSIEAKKHCLAITLNNVLCKNSYLCYKDEKENISDDLLEIAGRGNAESSNINESEMLFMLFFSRLQ